MAAQDWQWWGGGVWSPGTPPPPGVVLLPALRLETAKAALMVNPARTGAALLVQPTSAALPRVSTVGFLPGVQTHESLSRSVTNGELKPAPTAFGLLRADTLRIVPSGAKTMPQAVADFGTRLIGEKIIFSLDFGKNLGQTAAGQAETITSAAWALAVVSGSDPTAASRITAGASGIAQSVVSSPIVDFSTGIIGSPTRYMVSCAAVTSLGETIIGIGHVTVQAPA
jgi:hypothetical protein